MSTVYDEAKTAEDAKTKMNERLKNEKEDEED